MAKSWRFGAKIAFSNIWYTVHRFYVRAPVLSNLLNSFGQTYKMLDKATLLIGLPQRVKPIQ